MHQIGDIIRSKQGKTLLVLAKTDSIIEEMTDIITNLEPIIIAVPVRFSSFTKDGFLVAPQYSNLQKPMIAEYYNRVYLYEKEIASEIGFVSNSKVLTDITNIIKSESIDCKLRNSIRKVVNICRSLTDFEITDFQNDLRVNNPDQVFIN